MPAPTRAGYHHGDLQSTLLASAMGMLEQGEPFSLRAVARRAGVSPSAPYRHFADRDSLVSALAAQGFRDLRADLTRGRALPSSTSDLAEFGVAYVDFALRRPALFRLMLGNECAESGDAQARAAAEVRRLLARAMAKVFPEAEDPSLATAGWALVHGLACLHSDGSAAAAPPEQVAARVHSSVRAIFSPAGRAEPRHSARNRAHPRIATPSVDTAHMES